MPGNSAIAALEGLCCARPRRRGRQGPADEASHWEGASIRVGPHIGAKAPIKPRQLPQRTIGKVLRLSCMTSRNCGLPFSGPAFGGYLLLPPDHSRSQSWRMTQACAEASNDCFPFTAFWFRASRRRRPSWRLATRAKWTASCWIFTFPACRELSCGRKLDGSGQVVPVVFITAIDDDEVEQAVRRLGCVDYLRKPFAPEV